MVKVSERFVRLIIRRPHAYAFANEHKGAQIPGLAVLDAEGKLAGTADLDGDAAAIAKELEALAR